MKKLFFYSNIEYDAEAIGITKKVKGQVKAFIELGYEVCCSCYLRESFAIVDGMKGSIIDCKKNRFYETGLDHAFRRFELMNYVNSWLREKKFDAIYLRYHYFDRYTLQLLKTARKSADKIVMEMHSYPCLGKERTIDKVFSRLEKVYQKPCVDLIDLFANMSTIRLPFEKMQVQFRNTIDPETVSIRQPEPPDGILHMLSVAYERPAHGFDRVIRGLADYYGKGGKQKIHIIFAGKYMESTKQLVRENGLESCCEFIPPVSGEDLDDQYNRADVAIGHLANHRVNSFAGSAIKTQEFLAKGIPFVYAWEESMIPDDYPYVLKCELDEKPIDIDLLINWWRKNIQDPLLVARTMRRFFESSAGWKYQMSRITDALEGVDRYAT